MERVASYKRSGRALHRAASAPELYEGFVAQSAVDQVMNVVVFDQEILAARVRLCAHIDRVVLPRVGAVGID